MQSQGCEKIKITEYTIEDLIPNFIIFLWKERNDKSKVSFFVRLKMWRYGFFGSSYYNNNFKENKNYKDFLNDYEWLRTRKINGKYTILLNNKLLFKKLIEHDLNTPEIFFLINNENEIVNDTTKKKSDLNDIIQLLEKQRKIIVKPIIGSEGKGVYLIEKGYEEILVNGKKHSTDELIRIIRQQTPLMVCEFIKQDNYAQRIAPYSLNTIRLITMRDPHTKKVFIPVAFHRFGTKESFPTDNVSKGGIFVHIDIETGKLKKEAFTNNGNKILSTHPETKVNFENINLPMWEQIINNIIKVAEDLYFLDYIGWDIAITEKQFFIIEGNTWPGIGNLQLHVPLLIDKRVKEFFKAHKIIR